MSGACVFFRWTKLTFSAVIFSATSSVFSHPRQKLFTVPLPNPHQKLFALEADAFTGIRYSAFEYQASYNYGSINVYSEYFSNNTLKSGPIVGGSLGLIRMFHYTNVGLVITYTGYSSKSMLSNQLPNLLAGNIVNRFSIKYQFDLALMFGVNVTPKTVMYAKIGPSNTNIKQNETLFSFKTETKEEEEEYSSFENTKNKWGGMFGLGVKYFLNKRIGVFAEYDYYYYGRITLPTVEPVTTVFENVGNTLTQNVEPNFGALHFGININIF